MFLVSLLALAPDIYFSDKLPREILDQNQNLNFAQIGIAPWYYVCGAYAVVLTAQILVGSYLEMTPGRNGEYAQVFE